MIRIKRIYEFNREATLDVYNNRRKLVPKESENAYKVYWESGPTSQKFRFKNLLGIGVKEGDTVLDYGCGLGDLYNYTKDIGLSINYIGVDINKNFVGDAKSQYGVRLKHLIPFNKINPKFYSINTIDDVKDNFDWFIASGVFTYSFEIEEIIEILIKAFKKCNKGISFNILPARYYQGKIFKMRLGNDYLNSFNPKYLLEELKKHFNDVKYSEKMFTYEDKDGFFYIYK